MGLWDDIQKFRLPIMLGAGGIVAYSAYQNARRGQSAAPADAGGAAPAASGIGAEAALGVQSAAFLAGGGLGLQGAALGLQTADRGIDLAGIATMGAQALSGDVLGLARNLGENLADVSQAAIGTLPSFAPAEGIAPQPTTAAPAAPTTSTRRVSLGYRVTWPSGGTITIHGGRCGAWQSRVRATTGGTFPVSRGMCATNQVHWRFLTGPYGGWHLLSWAPGAAPWRIQKGTRTETLVNGVRTGSSDSWASISRTGS